MVSRIKSSENVYISFKFPHSADEPAEEVQMSRRRHGVA